MDTRGPARYLWWLARQLKGRVALGAMFGSLWFASLALTPYLLSQAIDRGLGPRRPAVLLAWTGAVLVTGAASAGLGIMRHRSMTKLRLAAALRTADAVMTHATRLGAALPRRVTSGEVVTIGISDVWTIGRAMNVGGVGVASALAYTVVSVLLFRTSPMLAFVALGGVPVLGLAVGPLLLRVQAAATTYRKRQGGLAAQLVDVIEGLRILNGLGGKQGHLARFRNGSAELRDLGYRVGRMSSWVGALGEGLPGIFLAVVIWLAAREAAAGRLTVGELVAVYGYTAMLVVPVSVFIFCGFDVTRGLVSARHVVTFLRLPPEDTAGMPAPDGPAGLHDPDSGVRVEPGRLTVLASARPADTAAVLERLGRYGPTDATWGGLRLDEVALDEVRARILVAEHSADLFPGTLGEVIAGPDTPRDERIETVIGAAAARDVGAPDHLVEWGGRNLSGGQRQRVRLARALYRDAEVLLAAEPTSAVDAHTEAAIASRLRTARAGRTTVLATTSPVVLDQADVVHYLVDGRVAASGTHRHLLTAQPGYHRLVARVFGEDE
ncbi:ABC-type multidrug transport system fused ATPase/permease subunit [Pseudosporangium ferrugineum]|uniref:ABC-type multidrug transport system fused ATPase/permease subunit n=2 Tax=Pseudosporangium ferrugineum TaxID=439699 RepID=A0A2T0RI13_9ACTN|nr:ABC-type multidrug transport system fused ATPase/permease subunit [Pseudosporangium ferrugineum]